MTKKDKNIYTCPMHPNKTQNHMGTCNICDMELEALSPSALTKAEDEKKITKLLQLKAT